MVNQVDRKHTRPCAALIGSCTVVIQSVRRRNGVIGRHREKDGSVSHSFTSGSPHDRRGDDGGRPASMLASTPAWTYGAPFMSTLWKRKTGGPAGACLRDRPAEDVGQAFGDDGEAVQTDGAP